MSTYAIVKSGGKQYKVAVGDLIKLEKLYYEIGMLVNLPVVLLVANGKITYKADKLLNKTVVGKVVSQIKGPKIRIHKFKNKTGYHKRQGHRQNLTILKITDLLSERE